MKLKTKIRRKIRCSYLLVMLSLFLLVSCQQTGSISGETLSSQNKAESSTTQAESSTTQTEEITETNESSDNYVRFDPFLPQGFRSESDDLLVLLHVFNSTDITVIALSKDPSVSINGNFIIEIEEKVGDTWQPVPLTNPSDRSARKINDFMTIVVEDDGSYGIYQFEDIGWSSLYKGFFEMSYDISDYTELKPDALYRIRKSFGLGDDPSQEYELEFTLEGNSY